MSSNPSFGTYKRYIVQEKLSPGRASPWHTVERFEAAGDAFELIRDQQRLMVQGRRKYPDRVQDYDRRHRVMDGRRNREVIWPGRLWIMPPHRVRTSDHVTDALSYVTYNAKLSNLRTATLPSSMPRIV